MQLSFTKKKNIRKNFGKLKEGLSIPNLIEVQKNSYKELTEFKEDVAPQFIKGFDRVFKSIFPIEDLNDKASSTETHFLNGLDFGGKARLTQDGLGLVGTKDGDSTVMSGVGKDNNIIASYRQAIKIMTEPMTVRHNILAIPGIRDPYITDFAAGKVRDYSMAMYIMDVPNLNGDQKRIFE